jgi:mannose-6-phosphate isomerase-like protein (cupin superfamily)
MAPRYHGLLENCMSMDMIDRGMVPNESEEMRRKREAILAASPPPTFFKLRAQMLAQGRSNQTVARTDHLQLNLKVYAGGGENGLHNHSDEDHVHLILQGSAVFYGPRGEERHCGPYEGILLPVGCFYRFQATSEEPLVLLRVSAKVPGVKARTNIYGDPIPNSSKANGKVPMIPLEGVFWGAEE